MRLSKTMTKISIENTALPLKNSVKFSIIKLSCLFEAIMIPYLHTLRSTVPESLLFIEEKQYLEDTKGKMFQLFA